jgi:hypothetical protein
MREIDLNSPKTAITRTRLSVPIRLILYWDDLFPKLANKQCLDYGCGRSIDAQILGVDKYDKYHHYVPLTSRSYDIVFCTYVLNAVSLETELEILQEIETLLKPEGLAYISVRRDIPKWGTRTQRYVKLPFYELFEDKRLSIYRCHVDDLKSHVSNE